MVQNPYFVGGDICHVVYFNCLFDYCICASAGRYQSDLRVQYNGQHLLHSPSGRVSITHHYPHTYSTTPYSPLDKTITLSLDPLAFQEFRCGVVRSLARKWGHRSACRPSRASAQSATGILTAKHKMQNTKCIMIVYSSIPTELFCFVERTT